MAAAVFAAMPQTQFEELSRNFVVLFVGLFRYQSDGTLFGVFDELHAPSLLRFAIGLAFLIDPLAKQAADSHAQE